MAKCSLLNYGSYSNYGLLLNGNLYFNKGWLQTGVAVVTCLLYTSDAADE